MVSRTTARFAIIVVLYTSLGALSFFLLSRWFRIESRRV